jgi:8-amino-7-oxononanoate synthase
MSDRWAWLQTELNQMDSQLMLRKLQVTQHQIDGYAVRDGRRMLNLASNDYLGLGAIPYETYDTYETSHWGAGAARLVVGNHPVMSEFEQQFAHYKETQSVLLFNSGYAANVGVISALFGRGDLIFCDRLNHASIIDGAILSRAELVRYAHRNLDELETALKKAPPHKKKLIISDTVFSMDGTVAPLSDLVTLRNRYGAILIVDEAHSGGVFGEAGQGLTHAAGLTAQVDLQIGTFSKAYGRFGAYVACDEQVRTYLLNKARSFVYTTALPPVFVQAIHQQWQKVKTEHWRRQHVLALAARFRHGLLAMGLNVGDSESQIVPLIVGSNERALHLQQILQTESILAVAIRPPTVPQGTARIRFSWTAAHQIADVEHVLDVIKQWLSAEVRTK